MDDRSHPRKASEWLVALIERPEDPHLRLAFETWLADDPAHLRDWQEMSRTYEVMGRTRPAHAEAWAASAAEGRENGCLLYTSPSPRDLSTSRMPSSA